MMGSDFFSNRELYDLISEVKSEMAELKEEMAETRAIIRNYNNLRTKIEQTDARVNMLIWVVGISIPAVGLVFTMLNYIRR